MFRSSESLLKIIIERFTFTNLRDFTSGRNYIYLAGFDMFYQSPLIGHGIYSVPSVFAIKYNLLGIQQMHNIYLQFMAELGIIGTIIIVTIIIYNYQKTFRVFRKAYSNKNLKLKFMIGSSFYVQTLWIIYGFFGNPFTEHVFLLIYILATAISYYYYKERKTFQ